VVGAGWGWVAVRVGVEGVGLGDGGGWGDGVRGGCAVVVAICCCAAGSAGGGCVAATVGWPAGSAVGVVGVPGSAWAGETGCFLVAGVRDTRVSTGAAGSAGRIAVAAVVVRDGVFPVGTARSVAAAVIGLVVGSVWLGAAVVVVEVGVPLVRAAYPLLAVRPSGDIGVGVVAAGVGLVVGAVRLVAAAVVVGAGVQLVRGPHPTSVACPSGDFGVAAVRSGWPACPSGDFGVGVVAAVVGVGGTKATPLFYRPLIITREL
jgi:hypothetical protein